MGDLCWGSGGLRNLVHSFVPFALRIGGVFVQIFPAIATFVATLLENAQKHRDC